MLFHSYSFLFLFLPLVFAAFFYLEIKQQRKLAFAWLVIASWFFYAWWQPFICCCCCSRRFLIFVSGFVCNPHTPRVCSFLE